MHTLAGISYVACKFVRPSSMHRAVFRHTEALSGMKRSPRTRTSREAIPATYWGSCGLEIY